MSDSVGEKGLEVSAFSAPKMGKLRNFMVHAYLCFCILAFVVTATAKLSSDFSLPLMNAVDPVFFFIKAKYLLVMISIVELGVAFFLIKNILSGRPMKGVIFVLWLCMLFVLYRIAFLFSPARVGTCKCFGVGSFFGFMEEKSDFYSLILLGIMLLGGIILVLWDKIYKYMKLTKPDINCATVFLFLIIFLFGCNGIVAQSSLSEIDNASKKLKIHPVVTNQTEVSIQQKDNTGVSSTKGSTEKFLPLYTAEGILYMEYLMAGKSSLGDALFSISVDALGRWNIVLRQKKGAVEYMNCDGTNIFHLFGLPQNVPLSLPMVLKEDLSTGQNATYRPNETTAISVTPLVEVYSGSFPTTYNRFGILWLAFAGGHYLETTNDIPNLLEFDPINNPFAWCTDFFYKNEVESSFPLLREGSFIVNTNLIKGDTVAYQKIKEPQGESTFKWLQQRLEIMQKIPAELFLRGSYSLIESKQIGTLKVPVLFSTSSRPDILVRQDDSDGNRFIGQVTNIIVAPGEYFLVPQIEGEFTIHDFRFMKRTREGFFNSVVYKSTNNLELDVASERLRDEGSQDLFFRKSSGLSVRTASYYFSLIFIALFIISPVFFYLIKK